MSTDGPADGRGVLGAKAGATYVSIFAGRVADEGGDAPGLVHAVRERLDLWGSPPKLLPGGIRPPPALRAPAARGRSSRSGRTSLTRTRCVCCPTPRRGCAPSVRPAWGWRW